MITLFLQTSRTNLEISGSNESLDRFSSQVALLRIHFGRRLFTHIHGHHFLSERRGDLLYYYTKLPGKTFINLSDV